MNGILLVNKKKDMTSRDVVNLVGKYLNTRKIGHTGTLDPLATGVMVLCVGKATKLVDIITANEKEYIAKVILGVQTDTGDITGNIKKEESVHISYEKITEACKNMVKTYEQTVPIYSAVKINGKKLYEYAREGKEVSLPTRTVTISSCVNTQPIYENGKTIFTIRTTVSKGTYIRSLIEDLASSLHTIGTMTELTRTKQGSFSLEECQSLEELESGHFIWIDFKPIFEQYPKVVVERKLEQKIKNGCPLLDEYDSPFIYFENEEGTPLAIYEKDLNHIGKIKPWKMLIGL